MKKRLFALVLAVISSLRFQLAGEQLFMIENWEAAIIQPA